ncbi:HpcH/HpaI aldolase/citrate lyase family protein [Methylobacterium sp. NEAU K]|uniref:HpcH/HpaI aldolase family protein n=1 Tax=Methylobacterium sp. NEAU K TaxID=3064946 RepID=UPI002734C755|nr:aldolase/citrate lyase family protein [Methylobacterium sp. NEAU K]MDP4004912.1 aldolase/citrate lyase family protein [Methylobacterium sp. NEAU K]
MTLPVPSLPDLLPAGPARFLGWSCIADPAIAGALARAGFDAVLLDQQHGAHDYQSSCAAITEVALAGKPTLVRVPVGDFAMASRMLDAGASGIVAPMINTVADARALAAATKYPPVGQRSWGPDRAMWMSGLLDGSDYLAAANDRALTIAMCETAEAIDALEAILVVPGIDGILVGPADLSIALSKGAALDPLGSAVTAALGEIVRKTRAAGKLPCAFAHAPARAREMVAMGFQLVSVEYDAMTIVNAFARLLCEADPSRAG